MWSIFQLQDILGINKALRRENPHEERINIPAIPKYFWKILITKADGSAYAMIRYASLGFWVSYNRTADPTVIVTITIQKI